MMYRYMGNTAKRMFEDEKPAVVKQIDDECQKYAGQSLPIPTKVNVLLNRHPASRSLVLNSGAAS